MVTRLTRVARVAGSNPSAFFIYMRSDCSMFLVSDGNAKEKMHSLTNLNMTRQCLCRMFEANIIFLCFVIEKTLCFKRKNTRVKFKLKFSTFQVAAINSEIVDSALSMAGLTFLILGLTNEWLESMNALIKSQKPGRGNFPILVNGTCELFSLQKLFKTLSAALPSASVKILKMPQSATTKQSINR